MPSRAYMPASATVEWATPQDLFDALHAEFQFTLDAAASATNAKVPRYFTKAMNGLARNWGTDTVWLNPPYGAVLRDWMRKAYESARAGATVVCLVPARTDTKWWHEYAMQAADIRFVQGRLKFGGSPNPAPFPSVVVVFRPGQPAQGARAARVVYRVAPQRAKAA